MSKIHNPLVIDGEVKLIDNFSIDVVTKQYNDYGIDVSRLFEGLNNIQLYECIKTGYRYYYPFSAVGDAMFYEDLSTTKPNYYSNRWEHKKALGILSKYDKVLEVGAGFGAFMSLIRESGIEVKGLELNSHAVKECVEKGLNVEEKLVQDEALINKGKYDVVCYFQVLEHITEVHSFIEASIALIKNGGRLIVGVPNNNPYLFINDKYHTLNLPPHHAGLWNKKSLKNLEKIFNLKVETIEFEPLNVSYKAFIAHQRHKNKSKIIRKLINVLQKFAPKFLKKFCCKFINGRNVLVVYRKV